MNEESLDKLQRLASLRNSGALTEEEFSRQKAHLMGDPSPPLRVRNCPSCGYASSSNALACESCCRPFDGRGVVDDLKALLDRLTEFDNKIAACTTANEPNALKRLETKHALIAQKKMVIQQFPIPSERRALLDFLSLAVGAATTSWLPTDDGWLAQAEQAIAKAKVAGAHDPEMLSMARDAEGTLRKHRGRASRYMGTLAAICLVALALTTLALVFAR